MTAKCRLQYPPLPISIHAILYPTYFKLRCDIVSLASQMDSIEERALSSKILVGISLDARASCELLSWAVGNSAHPNDTIVALHVLGLCKLLYPVNS